MTDTVDLKNKTITASEAGRLAAEAGGRSAIAAAQAVENAAKEGKTTSEFKVAVATIGISALLGALKMFAIIPGPWQIPAGLAVAIITASAAYSVSRGKVKAAAIAIAPALVAGGSAPHALFPTGES